MFNRLLGYLVTLLMIAVLLDVILRCVGMGPTPSIVQFDELLGWSNTPGMTASKSSSEFDVEFSINSLGVRGNEIPYAKQEGKKRIVFVGDSFTLGYTVEEADLFHQILGQKLRDSGHDVEIINGGTEGYSTDQELVWLENFGLKYRPDFVVLAPYLNDVFLNTQDHYTDREKPLFELRDGELVRVNPRLGEPVEKTWFAKYTSIGNQIRNISLATMLPTTKVGARAVLLEDAPLLRAELSQVKQAWRVTDALVARFAEVVRAGGAKPVALLVANKWEIHDGLPAPRGLPGTPPEELHPSGPTDQFARSCEKAGFTVIDPREALRSRAAAGEYVYFQKDWHWNVAGNQVVADVLHDRFIEPDLLGPGSGTPITRTTEWVSSGTKTVGGLSLWILIPGIIWLILGFIYWQSTGGENAFGAYLKVALMIGFVVGVIYGVHRLMDVLSPQAAMYVGWSIAGLLILFLIWKTWRRIGSIFELYGSFLRRGHWYLLPLLVVVLSIGMLLVVAASSPFVAPFIYTLF